MLLRVVDFMFEVDAVDSVVGLLVLLEPPCRVGFRRVPLLPYFAGPERADLDRGQREIIVR